MTRKHDGRVRIVSAQSRRLGSGWQITLDDSLLDAESAVKSYRTSAVEYLAGSFMTHPLTTVILSFSFLAGSVGFVNCTAGELRYVFRGHFAPTDRVANDESRPATPSEVIGKDFTIRISWPTSADDYSTDWQTGTDHWGSYSTMSVSIDLDAPGLDLSIPPTIDRWETFNDTPLDYVLGVPQTFGDELRLVSRVDWTRTFEFVDNVLGQPRIETFTRVSQNLLSLRAVDHKGTAVVDDALQTKFDLTRFDDVRFEFQQIVPVAGSDPRPIRIERWIGVVESMVVVPEPTSICLACLGIFCFALLRKNCLTRRRS